MSNPPPQLALGIMFLIPASYISFGNLDQVMDDRFVLVLNHRLSKFIALDSWQNFDPYVVVHTA